MRHVDVYSLFDEVVYERDVRKGKDHPDIYLEAARRINASPEGCVVFEDILAGVRSAKAAGMQAVAVRCEDPRQPVRDLRREADLTIGGWSALLA